MSKAKNRKIKNKELGILEISNSAYQSYRKFTKGNFDSSKTDVAKKLTRNTFLGTPIPVEDTNNVWYAYGKLRILVKNGKKISCVMNHQPRVEGWEEDLALKNWLNKKLNIS